MIWQKYHRALIFGGLLRFNMAVLLWFHRDATAPISCGDVAITLQSNIEYLLNIRCRCPRFKWQSHFRKLQ